MGEIEIIQEKALTLNELKTKLEEVKKRDKELNFRASKTLEYLGLTVEKKQKTDFKKIIEDLGIQRLKDRHIAKIADLQPKDLESIKTLFIGENLTIKQEDMQRILECLK
ncbi:MAG: hypothetical protein Q8R00_00435 [Candidatus Nanoarchaeia archaeon]|nr:hypothetical protein [Candidatus Nanoarchaeia archaeon]